MYECNGKVARKYRALAPEAIGVGGPAPRVEIFDCRQFGVPTPKLKGVGEALY